MKMKKRSRVICSLICTLSMLLMLVGPFSAINVSATDLSSPWINVTFDDETGANTGTSAINATEVGTPVYSDKLITDNGPSGKYVSIDADNYLQMSGDAFKFGTDAFTVSTWINFPTNTPIDTTIRLFQTGAWGYNTPGFVIAVTKTVLDTIHFGTGVASSGNDCSWSWSDSVPDFFDAQWHQLVFIFDQPNNTIKTYLDGVKVATQTTTFIGLSAESEFTSVGLGLFVLDDTLPTGAVPVSLDNIAIYKSTLTSQEIFDFYKAPTISLTFDDASGANIGSLDIDATAVGIPVYSDKITADNGPSGKYVSIDADNYLKMSGDAFKLGTDAFTLSTWINVPSSTPSDSFIRLFQTGVWGDNSPGFAIAMYNNASGISFGTGLGSEGSAHSWAFCDPVSDFYDSMWHQLIVVFEPANNTIKIYVDGDLSATNSTVAEGLSAETTQSTVGIGQFLWNDVLTSANTLSLDNFAVYESAFSQSDVTASYSMSASITITIDPYSTDPTSDPINVTASTSKGELNTTIHTFTENSTFTFIATDEFGNIAREVVSITNIINPYDVGTPWMNYTFNDETAADSGVAENDGEAVGSPTFSDGPTGKYVSLDAANYLKAPGEAFQFGTGEFTFSIWLNIPSSTPSDSFIRLFQTGVWGDATPGFVIAMYNNASGISLATGVGSEGSQLSWGFADPVTNFYDDLWHQLTIVFDQPGGVYKIYVDANLVVTKLVGTDYLTAQTTQSTVGLGTFLFNDELMSATSLSLDNIVLYKAALTQDNVTTLYNSLIIKGDANRDASIDISDLVAVKQNLLHINTLVGSYLTAGDVNSDDAISISDLLAVQKHILGIQLIG